MKSNSIFIVGCGDIGIRVGTLLESSGCHVTGFCRDITKLPKSFTGYSGSYTEPGALDVLEREQPDFVLATFKPAAFTAQGYQQGFVDATINLLAGLGVHRPKAVILVSSTRVYAEKEGGWVNEDSPLATSGYAATAIVKAEQLLQDSEHSGCVVRFAGIYGDSNGRLLRRIGGGELCQEHPVRYANRIHKEDCAGFIAHLIGQHAQGLHSVYLGVDNEPAPTYETESWLARAMGVSAESPNQGRDLNASENDSGHKRCCSQRLQDSGYKLRYPSYREGYAAVLGKRD